MTAFVLQNQHGQFLSKENEWVSGGDANALFRSPHYDIALNQLIEINAKDHSLRGAVVTCELDGKGRPLINCQQADAAIPTPQETADSTGMELHHTPNLPDSGEPMAHRTIEESDTTAAHA